MHCNKQVIRLLTISIVLQLFSLFFYMLYYCVYASSGVTNLGLSIMAQSKPSAHTIILTIVSSIRLVFNADLYAAVDSDSEGLGHHLSDALSLPGSEEGAAVDTGHIPAVIHCAVLLGTVWFGSIALSVPLLLSTRHCLSRAPIPHYDLFHVVLASHTARRHGSQQASVLHHLWIGLHIVVLSTAHHSARLFGFGSVCASEDSVCHLCCHCHSGILCHWLSLVAL
jgi:hypothetical protein